MTNLLPSFLMGLAGGQRGITPLAAVSLAAASGRLPVFGPFRLLARPWVATGAVTLALAELAGDKQRTAPDRIVPIGLAARFTTCAIAGAVLAGRRQAWLGAAVGSVTAVAASYPGWRLRVAAMPRYGQMASGLVEDGLVVLGAAAVLRLATGGLRPAPARGWSSS